MKKEPETPEEKKAREAAEKAAAAQKKAEEAVQKVREAKSKEKVALAAAKREAQQKIDEIDRQYHGKVKQYTDPDWQKVKVHQATIRDCNEKIAVIDRELGN